MNKLIFPNDLGLQKPDASVVDELQDEFSFSDEYSEFLKIQNGFSVWDFKESNDPQKWVKEESIQEPVNLSEELKVLYAYNNNALIDIFIETGFIEYFFPVGTDPAGNIFVEVLIGRYQGYVGCINHEAFTISASKFINEVLEHYKNTNPKELLKLEAVLPSAFSRQGVLKAIGSLKLSESLDFFLLYEWDFCVLTVRSFDSLLNNITVVKKDGHYSMRVLQDRHITEIIVSLKLRDD